MSIETVDESVVSIVQNASSGNTYSHMIAIRDHVVKWLADPVYQAFRRHEQALEFFRHVPKATAAWVARIQFLRVYNPIYLKFVIESVKGTFAFEAAMARIAAQEAALTHAARIAALNAAAAASKGTLVVGTGTIVAVVVVPVVAMVAVQVALGSGYYQARQQAKKEGFASGFAKGFICGLLNWELRFTIDRFWDDAVNKNAFDEIMPALRATAHNDGLVKGRVAGLAKNDKEKGDYLLGLRRLTTTSKAGWSPRSDDWAERMRARQVQVSYVIQLAGAARKHKIVSEG